MAERLGQQLGNYQLIRLLGRGGFADTYLGKHIYLESFAAIKVLQAHLQEQDQQTSFLQEARTIARLRHPHIVQVFDFGVDRDLTTPYLVMDYAPNGTLRQHQQRGVPIPLPTVASYVRQIADALQYAHNQNIIHRDVKPENMLLSANNEILLGDFGIAVIVQNTYSQNNQNIAGTVTYMAPEQLQGKPRPASDQYSLAVIVYEWLCGVAPFLGSYIEVAVQHENTPPVPLRKHVPTLPADVEQVVLTAMSKDPRYRFGSIQAFARAFEHARRVTIEGRSASTGPITTTPSSPSLSISSSPSEEKLASIPTVPGAKLTEELSTAQIEDANEQTHIPSHNGQQLAAHGYPVQNPNITKFTPRLPVPEVDNERTYKGNGNTRGTTTIVTSPATPQHETLLNTTNKLLLGVIALLLILMSSGFLYYTSVYHPAQIRADATGTVVGAATGTVLAGKNATASAIAQATGAAIATATTARTLYTQSMGGTPTITDPMGTPDNYGWQDFSDQYGACNFSGGVYHDRTGDNSYNPCIAIGISLTNFAMQVETTIVSGEFAGITFRVPLRSTHPGSGYVLFVGLQGTYTLLKPSTGTTSKLTSICSGVSFLTHTQLNKAFLMGLIVKGTTFNIYIDKQFVASCSDSTFANGNIGLLAASTKNGTESVYRNLQIWQL